MRLIPYLILLSVFFGCKKNDNPTPGSGPFLSLDSLKTLSSNIPDALYFDLTFISETTGFAISQGFVVKTTDGGTTWTSITLPVNATLKKIQFADTNTGYIIGGDNNFGVLLKTTDGGQSWAAINLNTLESPSGMFFLNTDTGFITGKNLFAKTTDGGQTWTSLKSNGFRMFQDVNFKNNKEGYVTSSGGIFFKTMDGGNSWDSVRIDHSNFLYEIYFADEKTFVVQSRDSLIDIGNGGAYIRKPYSSDKLFYFSALKSIGIGSHYNQGVYPYGDIFITNDNWKTFTTKTFSTMDAIRFTAIAKVNESKIMILGTGFGGTTLLVFNK